ncbi:MAG: hypothetical protein ACLP50_28065 [Solirubrobacteraceae bacterium]
MFKLRNAVVATAVGLALATLTVSAGLAASGSTARGGRVRVYEVYGSLAPNASGSDVITGAITDIGSDTRNVSPGINEITLANGSFEIDTSKLTPEPVFFEQGPSECSFRTGFTGEVTIVPSSGTGSYAGITGSVDVIVHTVGTAPLASTGCDTNPNDVVGGLSWLEGSGSVSFH